MLLKTLSRRLSLLLRHHRRLCRRLYRRLCHHTSADGGAAITGVGTAIQIGADHGRDRTHAENIPVKAAATHAHAVRVGVRHLVRPTLYRRRRRRRTANRDGIAAIVIAATLRHHRSVPRRDCGPPGLYLIVRLGETRVLRILFVSHHCCQYTYTVEGLSRCLRGCSG